MSYLTQFLNSFYSIIPEIINHKLPIIKLNWTNVFNFHFLKFSFFTINLKHPISTFIIIYCFITIQ